MGKFRHLEIKPWVVYADEHIGCKIHQIPLALRELREYGSEIFNYLRNPKKGGLVVVFGKIFPAPNLGHTVAALKAKFRLGVSFEYPFHEVRAVQIATRLACNNIVFHSKLKIEN